MFFICILLLLLPVCASADGSSFAVERLDKGIYAAIARAGSVGTSNALLVEAEDYLIAAGAHLTKGALRDLNAAAASVSGKPIRFYILTHHHRGYSYVDFDFPPDRNVIMSWQSWQGLGSEGRAIPFPVIFFNDGMTFKLGDRTLVLSNVDKGHTQGDTLLFLPEAGVLFASDLLYFGSIGYLGEGHMQEWALAIELMDQLGAEKIVPGFGPVGSGKDLAAFRTFFRAFLTAVLRHIEKGDSLEKTVQTFALPEYEQLAGYNQFLRVNLERAYQDLKENFHPD